MRQHHVSSGCINSLQSGLGRCARLGWCQWTSLGLAWLVRAWASNSDTHALCVQDFAKVTKTNKQIRCRSGQQWTAAQQARTRQVCPVVQYPSSPGVCHMDRTALGGMLKSCNPSLPKLLTRRCWWGAKHVGHAPRVRGRKIAPPPLLVCWAA